MANVTELINTDFAVAILIGFSAGLLLAGAVMLVRAAIKFFGKVIKS